MQSHNPEQYTVALPLTQFDRLVRNIVPLSMQNKLWLQHTIRLQLCHK